MSFDECVSWRALSPSALRGEFTATPVSDSIRLSAPTCIFIISSFQPVGSELVLFFNFKWWNHCVLELFFSCLATKVQSVCQHLGYWSHLPEVDGDLKVSLDARVVFTSKVFKQNTAYLFWSGWRRVELCLPTDVHDQFLTNIKLRIKPRTHSFTHVPWSSLAPDVASHPLLLLWKMSSSISLPGVTPVVAMDTPQGDLTKPFKAKIRY